MKNKQHRYWLLAALFAPLAHYSGSGWLKPSIGPWSWGLTTLETDTGTTGTGLDLQSAYAALRNNADREIFLDTARFLILDPYVPITEPIFEIFRPDCKVVITDLRADLKKAHDYLSQHPPKQNLARIRAAKIQHSDLSTRH